MNENRNRDPQPGADEALGAALGEAIGRQAESPVTSPPVADIAQRAAARARARSVRQAVVGVAAAAVLIAGGVVAWNTLDGDGDGRNGSVLVATEPTVPEQAPTSDGPAEPRASDATPAAPQPAEPAAPEPAGTSDDAGQEPSGVDADDLTPDDPNPEALSTGPVLVWTEVTLDPDMGLVDIYGLESVGDGRIVARAWDGSRDFVVVSEDGTTWTALPVPTGISISSDHVDIAGDRWVVGGQDTADFLAPSRVFFSDDEGVAWTELVIDTAVDDTLPSYCHQRSRVESVLASGDRMVVLVGSHVDLDLPALLVARGLAPDRESIFQWDHGESSVVFYLGEPNDPERIEVPHSELGLAPGQEAPCTGSDSERIRILTSDGTDTETAADRRGWSNSAISTADGFDITLSTPDGPLRFTSPDGRTWSETSTAGDVYNNAARGADGTIWHTGWVANNAFRVQRSGVGEAPTTVATLFDGLQPGDVLAAGPAGLVVTAMPRPDAVISGLPTVRIAKDGYELRFNEPEGGFTLWDLTGDVAVREFGPEALQSVTAPEGIREVTDEAGAVTLVFEDPETGDDLVAFSQEDVSSEIEAAAYGVGESGWPEQPATWIGWSADGVDWGWQIAGDAFGIDEDDGYPWVDLAVGDDFVFARVEVFTITDGVATAAGSGGPPPAPVLPSTSRWFIASVQ